MPFNICKNFQIYNEKRLFKIDTLFAFRLARPNNGIKIETSENTKVTKAHRDDIMKNENKKGDKKRGDNPQKFELYFKFQGYLDNLHSHQTLAINRGENLKVKYSLGIL